jgi:hypothetical protein
MTEIDMLERVYQGAPGETATINVTATNTTHMVTFSLNNAPAVALPKGQALQFPIPAHLLMVFAYDNPSGTGGSYTVALTEVDGFEDKKSQRIYKQAGASPKTKTYTFLV